MRRGQAIGTLIDAIDRYLARRDGDAAQVAEVRRHIAAWRGGAIRETATNPVPDCGYLEPALAACDAGDLVGAIDDAASYLNWETYGLYPSADIGARWPAAHAMTSLIGATGPVAADDFELGLFLMAPRTLYRDHHHPAPELYVPLTGPHEWRFAPGAAWTAKSAHMPVWNEPNAIHATLVRDVPFLCLYGWTRDVNAPAKVVFAPDWAAIEASL